MSGDFDKDDPTWGLMKKQAEAFQRRHQPPTVSMSTHGEMQEYAAQAYAAANAETIENLRGVTQIGYMHIPLMEGHVVGGQVCWCAPDASFDKSWLDGSVRLTVQHHDLPVPSRHAG